jgi:hypothetical protein
VLYYKNPQNLKCQIKISTPKTIFDRSTGKNTSVCVLVCILGNRWWFFSWWWNLHSFKEVLDNCIDEFVMGAGKTIEVTIRDKTVNVRDYGRNSSWESHWCSFKMNTGGKYDSLAFKKSVGLNGVGTKAVNALSNTSCGISSWWETKPPNFQLVIWCWKRRLLILLRKGNEGYFYSDEAILKITNTAMSM